MGINNATWQELNDPWNEWGTAELDFEQDDPTDDDRERWIEDRDWWREQDAQMEAEELERIEIQAEMEELRHNGYGE